MAKHKGRSRIFLEWFGHASRAQQGSWQKCCTILHLELKGLWWYLCPKELLECAENSSLGVLLMLASFEVLIFKYFPDFRGTDVHFWI